MDDIPVAACTAASSGRGRVVDAGAIGRLGPGAAGAGRVRPPGGTLGVPGPYPGRVIEVRNPALKRDAGGTARPSGRPSTGGSPRSPARTIPSRPGGSSSSRAKPSASRSCPTAIPGPHLARAGPGGDRRPRSAGIKLKDMVVFDRYGLRVSRRPAIRRSCPTASPAGA